MIQQLALLAVLATDAARVGDAVITMADLESAASVRLLHIRTERYEARRAAVDERAGRLLVAARAAALGITPAEWLARETERRSRDVTPEELAAAYESLSGPMRSLPKEQGMAELARSMREARRAHAERSAIRELLRSANVEYRIEPPRLARHDLGGVLVHGPNDARVTMVLFEDFECPRCAQLVPVLATLRAVYGNRIRIVHRDTPLSSHPHAKAAAEAVGCANEQGAFWEMAALLYAHQDALDRVSLQRYATGAGVDAETFASCLDSGRQSRAWKEGLASARELALRGTPTIFINGRLISGVRDSDTYAAIIEEELGRTP